VNPLEIFAWLAIGLGGVVSALLTITVLYLLFLIVKEYHQ
jgi:hypothetical protein